ncbi:MAG: FAD-dependent 5-carboxymethylaminomethyl-2-thiouridine(34) oxidoreductase MnmC [Rhizobacter sp.]|nr:FAD-dependent 5-carboxymethylaminomethyl-2-thiouridine(34) oxidoreductase MnmC [Rhizobacter sp.]
MSPRASEAFLAGNDLPQRWGQRERFVILETGFGTGHNFLATWQAWRDDPARCERLVFIAVEPDPLTAGKLQQAHINSPWGILAAELTCAWPPLTPNLHSLHFEQGQVQLLLALGDLKTWLLELVAHVDAFYIGDSAWQPRMFKALARLAAPDATLATQTTSSEAREGLRTAGFGLRQAPSDITLARYAPSFTPRKAPSRMAAASSERRALIVGAGMAGCASAWALAEQGWRTAVFDRHASPAQETSGNPAGLFHGIVNAQDGTHARFNRAAALHAKRVVADAGGMAQGLLRLDAAEVSAMSATLEKLGLPADYVQAVSPAQASTLSGLALHQSAWFYPGGGWVEPARLARGWMTQAAAHTSFCGSVHVARLFRSGNTWQLLNAQEQVIDEAEVVVLANAGDALRLLGQPDWPIEPVRGQISQCDKALLPALPKLPIAGAGYLLPDVNGMALFGASSQAGDMDGAVRDDDHRHNLAQLARLVGHPIDIPLTALQGRTGWRWVAQDKLPVIGAVPDLHSPVDRPLDQPRLVPRLPGLYVFTALGSRGITWSALGARVLASLITGAPSPLEASLLDAIDPARFVSRGVRSQASRESRRTPEGD